MAGRRVERLNEQFRREMTEVLRSEARDPRLAQVTLTGVRVAPDLTYARVYVAPPLEAAVAADVLAGLNAAAPFLRKALGVRLHVRRVPELHFELDGTLAYARHIEALLHEVTEGSPGTVPEAPGDPADG